MVGDKKRLLQCASLVHCHSRRQYAHVHPVWNRFWAKLFLTEALVALGGAAAQCMLDNASILVARGTGKNAVIAPEMVALGERFGFRFVAHELGDVPDVDSQLRAWCRERDAMPKKVLGGARPMDLFVAEAAALRPLPIHVPEPYRITAGSSTSRRT